ncbi:unnamed protein product [Mesocestoides corti]|uniref:Uncharacterized protein n=2 Tax=Mesocestoides corti TaxID=53468 RepID=A0A0R3U6T1_MESCO|nr:unnamed protein product [Mesocestoides corti]
MENGLAEIHLISLPSEVASLKLVDTPGHPPTKPQKPNLGNLSGNRTPSPAKRCQDFTFIDDGAVSSSSSATSTKEREKPRHCSEDIENHQCSNRGSHVALDKCPSEVQQIPSVHVPDARTPSDVCEMTPAPTRRLPTVVVLGYQRAVAESQAAAERLHQEQLRQGDGKASLDCPLTLSIGSGGLVNHGISPSPHGRNNRVKCSPSEDLHILPQVLQPPPPQSSPTHDLNFPPSATVTFSSPATVEETSSDERLLVDQPSTMAAPSNSPLSSSPPDVGPLWQVVGTRHVAEDAESIAESVYHQPPKAADRGAAYRLARRLFTLDGFKITDVAKHLCKRFLWCACDALVSEAREGDGVPAGDARLLPCHDSSAARARTLESVPPPPSPRHLPRKNTFVCRCGRGGTLSRHSCDSAIHRRKTTASNARPFFS